MAVRRPSPPGGVDLDALFRDHATPLLRLAVVLTGDRPLAEELVQDAFVRLHRSGSIPAAGTELAYLRRTVINLSHGHHRHLRVVRRHSEPRVNELAIVDGQFTVGGLWMSDADGRNAERVVDGSVSVSRWSPDGTRIVYGDEAQNRLMILDLASGESVPVPSTAVRVDWVDDATLMVGLP